MKQTKTPLSQEQRSEIWNTFWLHALAAVGAGLLSAVIVVFGQANGLPRFPTLVLAGVPTFLVWARFVGKIEKYKDSTGIPYPSTYIVLAIASVLMIVGPLVLFVSLLIRLSNVPRLEILREEQDTSPAPTPLPPADTYPTPLPAQMKRYTVALPIVQNSRITREPQPTPPIMKPEPEEKPPVAPIMDDDAFYEQVAGEIESDAMKPGIWARAFAETDGENDRAKALYIRLRVAQLVSERDKELEELARLLKQRVIEEEQAREDAVELKRQQRAAELQKLQEMEAQRAITEEPPRQKDTDQERQRRIADPFGKTDNQEPASDALQSRTEAIHRFREQSAEFPYFPAKVKRPGYFFYWHYQMQLGADELLLVPKDRKQSEILVRPMAADKVEMLSRFWSISHNVIIEFANGTGLEVELNWKRHKILCAWLERGK